MKKNDKPIKLSIEKLYGFYLKPQPIRYEEHLQEKIQDFHKENAQLSKELQSHYKETKDIEESIKETIKQSNITEHKLKKK